MNAVPSALAFMTMTPPPPPYRRSLKPLLSKSPAARLQEAVQAGGMRPDSSKRGAIRSVYDGRYRFARYFSPKQHHRPGSLEQLFKANDVELFDVERDPGELDNLALDRVRNAEVIEAMNAKLNALVDREVGEDVGQMLPGGVDGGWVLTDAVYDV